MTARLRALLDRLPEAYATLEDSLLPGRGGDGPTSAPDPIHRPAPANLDVIDHRNLLVRGLRWWVDAVRDPGEHTQVGHDVARMCGWLAGHLEVMADEDVAELTRQLGDWLADAMPLTGERVDQAKAIRLPEGAEDAMVRVVDAARMLGVSVRTIQRRAPRSGGMVRLGDVLGGVRTVYEPVRSACVL